MCMTLLNYSAEIPKTSGTEGCVHCFRMPEFSGLKVLRVNDPRARSSVSPVDPYHDFAWNVSAKSAVLLSRHGVQRY